MILFDHEKLDVYNASIEFILVVNSIVENLPRGTAYLSDQLQRAASSIVLNIAEGAGEYSKADKSRFYRMAKRSATECAAIIEICCRLNLIEQKLNDEGRELLFRIVSMLIGLVK